MTWCSSGQKHQTPAFRQENGTKLPVSARNLPEVGGNGQFGVAEGLARPLYSQQSYPQPPSAVGRAIRGLPPLRAAGLSAASLPLPSAGLSAAPFPRNRQSPPSIKRKAGRLREGSRPAGVARHGRCLGDALPRRRSVGWLEAYAASCCCWPWRRSMSSMLRLPMPPWG